MKKKGCWLSLLAVCILGILIVLNPGQFFTKTLLRITGDYRTPDYENSESMLQKARSVNLYYDRLYKVKDYRAYLEFQHRDLTTIPFVQIYNDKKKLLKIASGSDCSWALMNFFSKKDSSNLVVSDSLMYDFVMDRLSPVDLKTDADTFHYYVLAGWVNYLPKLSNRLFKQTNEMHTSLQEKVCYAYVSFDFQDSWESEMEAGK